MTEVHRFPKWLHDERFEITHSPALDQKFSVVLFDRVSGRFTGCGHSIAEAAKAALKKRETPSTIRGNSRPFAGNSLSVS